MLEAMTAASFAMSLPVPRGPKLRASGPIDGRAGDLDPHISNY